MPTPIVISLADTQGFQLRQKAAEYIAANLNRTGAERGSSEEQGFGALAEIVVRRNIGMPEINPEDHPLGYDVLLPSGVKVDVKCGVGLNHSKKHMKVTMVLCVKPSIIFLHARFTTRHLMLIFI